MFTQRNFRFKRFVLTVLSFVMILPVFSQVDYEFWFAAPYANIDHAPQWPADYEYKIGGRPIYLRLATQDADADVTVSLPAVGETIASLNIPANSTATVDLTEYIKYVQCSNEGDVVEDKGLYIRSNALITAYYEIASVLNTDIFSLKGQNALGKEFYAPFQNKMVNDQYHNRGNGEEGQKNPDYGGVNDNQVYDPAFSYIVIVATKDNTTVYITPTTPCVGIAKGETKGIKLDRGQTYVVRAKGQNLASRMSGTYIRSTKPIAVTIGEDSVYPDYFTKSGDCEDYVGDQIVPVDVVGKEYIIVQGQGYIDAASHGNGSSGKYNEMVAITATMDNTIIKLDGAQYGEPLNKGNTVTIELTDPDKIYTFVEASHPVYAFHVSGYHCETAGALLPSVEMCSGSYKIGFVRTYGSQNDQEFYMNLMVKGDGEKDFLLNNEQNSVINNADFQSINGTDWKVARIYFSQSDLPEGAYFMQNTSSLYHMGMMNSTAHDWGGDNPGYRLMGSMYGYFSRFSDNYPSAKIVNNNDTSITVTRGTKVSLLADGGYKFKWVGYMWNGHDWDLLPSPYYLNSVNVENPYAKIDGLGIYKYVATITTACYDDVERSVLIKIVEPVDLYEVHDTVCYTPGLSKDNNMSQYYNLYNLNDTIVGKKGLITGYYVDHFEKYYAADTVIWDDYEDNRLFTKNMKVVNGSISIVDNPEITEGFESEKVGHLVKNDARYFDNYVGLSGELCQKSTWLNFDFSEDPLDLRKGHKFSFDIKYDSVSTGYANDDHSIYMELVDASGADVSLLGTILPTVNANNPEVECPWENVVFDFEPYLDQLEKIVSIRIRAYSGNAWYNKTAEYGYYLDNIKYYTNARRELVTVREAKNYTITEGDSLYVVVKNNFDITRVDTAMAYFSVKNPGKMKNMVSLADTCANDGNVLREFDLTDYNYQIGGALVASRYWYWDAQKTKPVENPEYVDIEASAGGVTFYAYVDDECDETSRGELTVKVSAVPEVEDAEVSVCEVPDLGGGQGLIDLDEMTKRITNDTKAKVSWYSNYECTKQIGQTDKVAVTDGTTFYAKVYNSEKCASYATLKVSVTPVPAITFDDFAICEDGGDVTLSASPSGGVYKGDGVTGGIFSPTAAGEGQHKLTYTITNDGCQNIDSIIVTVNPQVKVTLENKTGKLQDANAQAQLEAKISPASNSYRYTWKDAVTETGKNVNELTWNDPSKNLESLTTLTPKTKKGLTRPTYFDIDVEDTKTGCSATARVLVDVYIPVELTLNTKPVCAGTDVQISADRLGGNGPFTYDWAIDPSSTVWSKVNDSLILIKNPQKDVTVTVKVTDKNGTVGKNIASATAKQVIYANPVISLTGKSACQGDAMELVPSVTGGTTPYTHKWTGNTDVLLSRDDAAKASLNTKSDAGTYFLTYTVTDKNGCEASENVSAIINQKPVIEGTTSKKQACWADEVSLSSSIKTGSSVNASYKWISESASLDALSSSTIPNPTFKSNISGTHKFQVILTDEKGCKDTSDEVTIRIEPRPTVTVDDPTGYVCVSNQGYMLSATPSVPAGSPEVTYSYVWSGDVTSSEKNPMLDVSTAGTKNVSVKVTSSMGCESAVANGAIIVYENPIAEIATKSVEGCAADTVTLKANTSSSNVSYEWSSVANFVKNTGSTVEMILPENNLGTNSIDYDVKLTVTDNKTQCKASTTESVKAYRLPEVTINGNLEVCAGGTQVLTPNVLFANSSTYKVNWFLDTLQLSATDVEDPVFTQTGTGTFNIGVQITDLKGCVGKGYIAIKGLELPVANAGEDRTEEWKEDFTLFGSASGGAPSYTYLWSPEDSLTSNPTLQNPTANLLETTIFTLEVTDSKGCKGTDEVIITIIGQPLKVSILQRDSLCEGNSVTLEALPSGGTGNYNYKWYTTDNPSVVLGTEKTLEVSITESTTYAVELSSVDQVDLFPAYTDERLITVYKNPEISIFGGDEPRVCQGEVKTLVPIIVEGVAPYSYEWIDESSPEISVTRESYPFSNSQVTGIQKVTLTVTDAVGCKSVKNIDVMVDELPTVTIEDVAVCAKSDGQVKAIAGKTGLQPYTYTWKGIEDSNILSMEDNVINFNIDVKETTTKTLEVTITDDHGCVGKDNAIVTVKPLPSLELDPRYTVCAEAELELDINPEGVPGTYEMTWNDTPSGYTLKQSVETKSVFMSNKTGIYNLNYTITDAAFGCPKDEQIEIEVFPAVKLADIPDQIACSSTDLNISVKVVEGNPTDYTWIGSVSPKNSKDVKFNFAKEGEYEVQVVAGDQYCSDTKTFNVVVKPNPIVEIDGGPIKAVDFMANVELSAQFVRYTEEPYSHSWSEPVANNIASGANSQSMTTGQIKQTTDYIYRISDKYGCVDTAVIRLQTEMIIPQLRRLCDGTEVEIKPNELVDPETVCLTDQPIELCAGESAFLIPMYISGNEKSISNLSYKWTDDEGNVVGTDINLEVSPSKASTVYNLHVYNDKTGFYDDVTFMVKVHQNPTASIIVSPEWNGKFYTSREGKADYLVIDGNPSSEEYGVEFVSHKWTVSPDVQIGNTSVQRTNVYTTKEVKPLTLTYEVVDQYGCSTTTSREIEIVNQPIPVIIGNNVCENATATYTTEIQYPKGAVYYWEATGGTIISDPTLSHVQVTWESIENTTLTVNVYPKGDRDIEGVTRTIYVTPLPDVEINGKNHVCVGEYANYEAINNKPSMDVVYSWSVLEGYGEITNITYPVSDMSTVLWNKVGKDGVVLHALFGACTITDTLPVYIHNIPKADFTYEPTEEVYFKKEGVTRHTDSIFVDKEVTFTNLTKNADNYDFYWDFIGDGVYTENSKDAIYEYDEVGDFEVSLMVVENMWGCNNVVTKPLKVIPNPNCGMVFPNAFTPDLSENNTFYPVFKEGVLEKGYELRVYNRWGTLLWSTTDILEQWDGMYKGSVGKQDVYVYQCKATCEDIDPSTGEHRVLNIKGDVTIIR
ncbi:MAG: gliding motility-associated C-terminal domain-containing protein [Bacteroidales bacterium]|nr:gliding motility-associated C-terminal domain-containing protein [Bacteroidales bacterium]